MNISVMIDIVIAAVLLISIAVGWSKGLIRSLVGLAAMVLALLLSAQLSRAAAPEIVDRYLRPAAHTAIEERAEELSWEDAASIEDLRWNLGRVLDAIPISFVREQARAALDEVLPPDAPLGGAVPAPLEELGKGMADEVLDTLVRDVLQAILYAALFVVLNLLFRLAGNIFRIVEKLPVVRQLNGLGGALAGLGKGLILVCLTVWVLGRIGVLTPELAEGSAALSLLPGWLCGFGK